MELPFIRRGNGTGIEPASLEASAPSRSRSSSFTGIREKMVALSDHRQCRYPPFLGKREHHRSPLLNEPAAPLRQKWSEWLDLHQLPSVSQTDMHLYAPHPDGWKIARRKLPVFMFWSVNRAGIRAERKVQRELRRRVIQLAPWTVGLQASNDILLGGM